MKMKVVFKKIKKEHEVVKLSSKLSNLHVKNPEIEEKEKEDEGITIDLPIKSEDELKKILKCLEELGRIKYNSATKLVKKFNEKTFQLLQKINIQKNGKIVIVGDIQYLLFLIFSGQVKDLNKILIENGMPSENLFYLFNGDFVDRGDEGIEVLFSLYSLSLFYPNYVFCKTKFL
jgi:hypothetical protein